MITEVLGSNTHGRGLGQNKTLRVGVSSEKNLDGESPGYRIRVSGEVLQTSSTNSYILEGRKIVSGQFFKAGDEDSITYTGEIVDTDIDPKLFLEGASVGAGATQAGVLGGMNTSTLALIGAAGIGAYLIGQNS